ncbi:hypothetical protein LTR84_011204 [Exophiala bonariae]|uniref:Uncharacterized protein n=1 Tax=Exophiala bonariae TaxID=1690606 RepID=A0AAV9NIJ9_9EURO|nr:hypothetical protein LTR84_011204 [Exophiala bonariae]
MASNAHFLLNPKQALKSKKQPDRGLLHGESEPAIESRSHHHGLTVQQNKIDDQSSTSTESGMSRKSAGPGVYDHRALLNPRGLKKGAVRRKSPIMKSNPLPDSPLSVPDGITPTLNREVSGPTRSMLEGVYGVERRTDYPQKKVKLTKGTEPDPTKPHTSHTRHKGSGIVGNYMRPDPDTPIDATKLLSLVDLTNTDDEQDDDLQIIASNADQEVCYGHFNAEVYAYCFPKPRDRETGFERSNEWPVMRCTLAREPRPDTVIDVIDTHGKSFAKVNSVLAAALAPIMDGLRGFRTQARLTNRARKPDEWPHQPCSIPMRMVVNLYGRRGDVEKVGRHFGQYNLWLRPPMASEAGIPIVNPHAQKNLPPPKVRSENPSRVLADARTLEEATDAVSRLFDSFANEATSLAETEPPSTVITTPLLPHQKQALTFMLQHEQPRTYGKEESENSSLWRQAKRRNGDTIYREVVAGISVPDEPAQVLGGLLADVMGLGKTLEALSLVGSTLQEAAEFGTEKVIRSDDASKDVLINSKATLIVCPTSTVKNWEDQIAQHVASGSMNIYVHHGATRDKNPYNLANYEVVITTYGVISSEFSGRAAATGSPVLKVNWFRIILDEAHTIREQRALQSQAIYSIHSQRRWCLTGTPIQNRLDDLGSLTRFLRLSPYDKAQGFNQHIRGPAQAGDPSFLKALRVFVDSFTLRRLRDRIDLPERSDMVDKLEFSAEERQLHDFFKGISRSEIKELARTKEKNSGVQHHVLRGIMTLRLICAHGKELLKEKDLERMKGMTVTNAIDLDEDEKVRTITGQIAHENLSMMADAGLDFCRNCAKKICNENPQGTMEDDDVVRCYVLPCYDLICADCFTPEKPSFDENSGDQEVSCPFCSAAIAAQYVGFSGATAQEIKVAPDETMAETDSEEDANLARAAYGGPHTKTLALLEDIAVMTKDSAPLEAAGEPPLKCVVFSEFTSHLDLIERALGDKGYKFVRIDGKMSLNNRKKSMDALASDDSITILLASIKAAGQGLNLTAASRAFIMEPMWNPAAEAQAVDRIYRIGQKRPVFVKRYLINNSIEEKIVELQKRKQQLADVSMDRNHKQLSKQDVREQHMKDILALFK